MADLGNNNIEASHSLLAIDFQRCGVFQCPESGQIEQIIARLKSGGSGELRAGIYDCDAVPYPTDLLGSKNKTGVNPGFGGAWITVDLDTPVPVTINEYYGLSVQNMDIGVLQSNFGATAGRSYYFSDAYAGGLDDPFPGSKSEGSRTIGIYAPILPVPVDQKWRPPPAGSILGARV